MSASALLTLSQTLERSRPDDSHAQREIFERIRELRSAFDGPLDPESQRCLEAAGMLVAYLARMGSLCGDDVQAVAVRLLRTASEAETSAARPRGPQPSAAFPPLPRPAPRAPEPAVSSGATGPAPDAAAKPERTATDVMGDMMLGQILLNRGHVLEEHIHQAMK